MLPSPISPPPSTPASKRGAARLPQGAHWSVTGTQFRVWAPDRDAVEVIIEDGGKAHALQRGSEGFFEGVLSGLLPGTRYRYRLDGEQLVPDPASRWQPDGPHGASAIIDPANFAWTDAGWRGVDPDEAVIYELHVGTFTQEGTWKAALRRLPYLAELGITLIELMPVADFPGAFGWGYDGVAPYAPYHGYGTPDDMRRFVDAAHGCGIGVILDVVYNHFGPDGNFLPSFSRCWRGDQRSEWGDAPNFDGESCGPVREFYIANAAYWIDEFHLDGLRFDATQQIFDSSPEHVLHEMVRAARAAAGNRRIYISGENEPQDAQLLRPQAEGGAGCDALWNDDFHHSAMVAATGRAQAYYSDYRGSPQELVSAVRRGFLFQGQRFAWQDKRRGTATGGLPPHAFIHFLENHDQVANATHGRRLHQLTSPGRWRALTALLLLGPQTPLLLQGQEFAAPQPFLYFADHSGELAEAVRTGRFEFLSQFPAIASESTRAVLPNPDDHASFERCRLDWSQLHDDVHAHALNLHRDLLRLRRDDATLRRLRRIGCDGAVLDEEAFALRFAGERARDDRLLLINLGRDLARASIAEPLLAPPADCAWRLTWSSEDIRYGGEGIADLDEMQGWRLPAHAALLLEPQPWPGGQR